ncbi:hypothetical protein [Streptomyces sp. NBC_01190]|uniref:hypothetical protein n=1 Tax=Streptomyces sp. NBC_01190 TaxID=2903767 RepID=UPI00386ADFA1|nr:hypothetical protein OG519_17695 [Streptomyces sp. NBC_01190]
MHVMEVSIFRSHQPRALWCALTVHGAGGPSVGESGPSQVPETPDGWLFATGWAPGRGGAETPLEDHPLGDTTEARHLVTRLVGHALREASPVPRWYLLGEPEQDAHPGILDDALGLLGSAFSDHAFHHDAVEALIARAELTVMCSGRFEPPGQAGGAATHPDYYPLLLERISQLAEQGLRTPEITRLLRQEGFTLAPGRADSISLTAVQRLLREDVKPATAVRARPESPPGEAPGPGEWWLHDLAAELNMPIITLYGWMRRGWVTAVRKESHPPYRWILRADQAELDRLRQRRSPGSRAVVPSPTRLPPTEATPMPPATPDVLPPAPSLPPVPPAPPGSPVLPALPIPPVVIPQPSTDRGADEPPLLGEPADA